MPLDTAAKRVSALAKSLPLPDGEVSQRDRLQILWQYGGILVTIIPTRYGVFGAWSCAAVVEGGALALAPVVEGTGWEAAPGVTGTFTVEDDL